ncbi:hypothetical protein SB768_25155 [Burkholderia sp. SIMBA_043]|uniref:hypothetical protein n=1 Tax=Burkholderia TaxID=32008 RepID=UPI0005D7B9C4|nr:hypothetical protein [Burkholderia vietnamiensis]AJY03047.1 hypothetical protein AK36_6102 [Burkholderia vietnamiensis LMG 10929]UBI29152.1 hypothetical protein LA325_31200 [Burkholderia vietnamiensis]
MNTKRRGIFTVDFTCNETGYELSVFEITAFDAEHAERLARETLHPQFTWRCTGVDRPRDARE